MGLAGTVETRASLGAYPHIRAGLARSYGAQVPMHTGGALAHAGLPVRCAYISSTELQPSIHVLSSFSHLQQCLHAQSQWEIAICIVMYTYVYLWHRRAYTCIQNGPLHKCFEYMFDTHNYSDICQVILQDLPKSTYNGVYLQLLIQFVCPFMPGYTKTFDWWLQRGMLTYMHK